MARVAKKQLIAPPAPNLATAKNARPDKRGLNLLEAMNHPKLFGPIFSPPSWHNWKTVVKAVDGEKLTDAETEFSKSISGGRSSNQPSQ
jgi:hypothetical protein